MGAAELSRRRALGLAAAGAAGTAVAVAGPARPTGGAAGAEAPPEPVGPPVVPAEVEGGSPGALEVAPLDPSASVPPEAVVPVGFPAGVHPQAGDHVTVHAAGGEAVPLCSWGDAVPVALPGGGFRLGERTTTAEVEPALRGALARHAATGQVASVCLLDASGAEHQVLAVRDAVATARTATAPAGPR